MLQTQTYSQIRHLHDPSRIEDVPDQDSAQHHAKTNLNCMLLAWANLAIRLLESWTENKVETLFCWPEQGPWGRGAMRPWGRGGAVGTRGGAAAVGPVGPVGPYIVLYMFVYF